MTVADRIKELRTEKGITQTELAKRLGNKDKSTISKIESKGNDISLKDIKRIAEVLDTTPSYLMGWDLGEKNRLLTYNDRWAKLITDETVRQLVNEFAQLPSQQQEIVLNLVHSMLPCEHPEQGRTNNQECN